MVHGSYFLVATLVKILSALVRHWSFMILYASIKSLLCCLKYKECNCNWFKSGFITECNNRWNKLCGPSLHLFKGINVFTIVGILN